MTRRTNTQHEIRCAIYTRKSTEEGLEQEFNTLVRRNRRCRCCGGRGRIGDDQPKQTVTPVDMAARDFGVQGPICCLKRSMISGVGQRLADGDEVDQSIE